MHSTRHVAVGYDGGGAHIKCSNISVETMRVCEYVLFILTFAVGAWLTIHYSRCENDATPLQAALCDPAFSWHNNTLVRTFGVINVCVFVDFRPAIYVAPLFWSAALTVMVAERIAEWTRIWLAKEQKLLSKCSCCVLRCCIAYQILSLFLFSVIFAVHPHDLMSARIHTVPYLNLIVAVSLMSITNMWFAAYVGYSGYKFPCHYMVKLFMVLYPVVMVSSGAINLTGAGYALIYGHPWGKDCSKYLELRLTRSGRQGHYCDDFVEVGGRPAPWWMKHSTDNLWVFCALIAPLFWNLYLSCALRKDAQEIRGTLGLTQAPNKRDDRNAQALLPPFQTVGRTA